MTTTTATSYCQVTIDSTDGKRTLLDADGKGLIAWTLKGKAPNGWDQVTLRGSRVALETWLRANDYEDDVERVDDVVCCWWCGDVIEDHHVRYGANLAKPMHAACYEERGN
jgi:hypothetical protein